MKNYCARFNILFFIFMGMFLLSTAGCGFKLRNEKPLPPQLHTLYLKSTLPYGALTLQLKQVIQSLGVRLVSDPEEAQVTLAIFGEEYITKTLTQSANASTKEYTLYYQVKFQLEDKVGKVIYGPRLITTFRNYMVNDEQVLSSTVEQQSLQQEMQRDTMYQIINQLSSQDVENLFTHPPKGSEPLQEPAS